MAIRRTFVEYRRAVRVNYFSVRSASFVIYRAHCAEASVLPTSADLSAGSVLGPLLMPATCHSAPVVLVEVVCRPIHAVYKRMKIDAIPFRWRALSQSTHARTRARMHASAANAHLHVGRARTRHVARAL